MRILSFVPLGFEGTLVSVEVDIRRGIPGVDVVGLADSAVKEARERIRVAIRNSGLDFPRDRILVNLSPADVPKSGSLFDLPIAVAILCASGQLPAEAAGDAVILGELLLSGEVREVRGVLPAVAAGRRHGIGVFIVPRPNLAEAEVLAGGRAIGAARLRDLPELFHRLADGTAGRRPAAARLAAARPEGDDFRDMQGQAVLKRAVEVAVAGRHNLFLFGPPGSGKTMAALRIPSVLPGLLPEEAIEVTRIHSLAGALPRGVGLVAYRPFRSPHHSASTEGMVGGGREGRPGEISLAHEGTLFLDEAPEYRKPVLQAMREPLEKHSIQIVRAGMRYSYPADFQLVMAANPCPCGRLGSADRNCLCSEEEVGRYWKKLGGALLDRMDMRLPVESWRITTNPGSTAGSADMRTRIERAEDIQKTRYKGGPKRWNARINPEQARQACALEQPLRLLLAEAAEKLGLSARACAAVLRIARTIADLEASEPIGRPHLLEALQYRRYGDGDYFWA